MKLQNEGQPIELVAVCDVYSVHRDRAAEYIEDKTDSKVEKFVDYRDMIAKATLVGSVALTLLIWLVGLLA